MSAFVHDEFDYGNARLRARKAALLRRPAYDRLLRTDLAGAVQALADGPYGRDLDAVGPRHMHLRALHEAVSRHLARSLEEMRSFYAGSARGLVDLLLGKWDLHNLLTLLRGRLTAAPAEQTLANLVAIGALGGPAGAQLADQPNAERTVELLIRRRLPSPELARELARAWPAHARTGNRSALEETLVTRHLAQQRAALATFGDAGQPLARELERGAEDRSALPPFACEDPLGIAVPIAFVAATEAEARNLRLIGEGLSYGADPDRLAERLLLGSEPTR